MKQDGYVAADALAALAIVGLAVGGLLAGLHVIASAEAGVGATLGQAVSARDAAGELSSLVRDRGPFRSDSADFAGGSQSFRFACGMVICGADIEPGRLLVHGPSGVAEVKLPGARQATFRYLGEATAVDTWPPTPRRPPERPWQVLKAIVLQEADAQHPLTVTRIWAEQAANCDFDVVSRDCRGAAP
jgi:hypothetical protein